MKFKFQSKVLNKIADGYRVLDTFLEIIQNPLNKFEKLVLQHIAKLADAGL
jgi:hypothetical protein